MIGDYQGKNKLVFSPHRLKHLLLARKEERVKREKRKAERKNRGSRGGGWANNVFKINNDQFLVRQIKYLVCPAAQHPPSNP